MSAIMHVITESVPFGGAQRNTLLTVEGLRRRGHEVDLVCGAPGGELADHARAAGVRVHIVPSLVRFTDPLKDVRCFAALWRLFRALRPSVVHTHSTKAGFLGRLAARAAGVPIVIHTFHGFPFVLDGGRRARLFIEVERFVGRFTDASVCVAERLREEVASWRIPRAQRLVTIYSGIDFPAYRTTRSVAETKRLLGLADGAPIVGTVGHLRDAKSQEHLIEAIAILRTRFPEIRLVVVGEGERRPFLERRIHSLGLDEHVRLLGERADVADLLAVFDVYATSSLWEGVGRALTEAMYFARPIVATPVYGVTELVCNGETGLTAPVRNPEALAAAIGRLLTDRELARRLGESGRRLVVDLMDGEKMVVALEDLYAELAAGAIPAPKRVVPCAESPES